MNLIFDRSFDRSLGRIKDKNLLGRLEEAIIICENAQSIKNIPKLKKIIGFNNFYRLKLGNYRVGIELEKPETLRFIIVLHRKEIYRKFP